MNPRLIIDALLKGLGFGLMLQLAVGPVCLYVLNVSNLAGLAIAEAAVLGVVLIDGFYILCAVGGAAKFLGAKPFRTLGSLTGIVTLLIFGFVMAVDAATGNGSTALDVIVPAAALPAFIGAIILTASNPLTILFWSGVFSAKVAQRSEVRSLIWVFASGCLLSTMLFLTLAAGFGKLVHTFLSMGIIRFLNGAIGLGLIAFACKKLLALK